MAWFEWFTTFSQEVEVIWNRRWSIATWLFVLSRYSSLAAVIPTLLSLASYKVWIFSVCHYSAITDNIFWIRGKLKCVPLALRGSLRISSCLTSHIIGYIVTILENFMLASMLSYHVSRWVLLTRMFSIFRHSRICALLSKRMAIGAGIFAQHGSTIGQPREFSVRLPSYRPARIHDYTR